MNAPEPFTLGLHPHMPAENYHSTAAMSAGGLKQMRRSPAHYFGAYLDPQRPPQEETPAMKNGTLVHCALFEPDELAKRYAARPPDLDARTKDGKAWIQAAEARGAQVVTADQMDAAKRQAAAVRGLPDVAALLADGAAEQSAFWLDPVTGELCKCRPDFVTPAGNGVVITDGKTCLDASPEGFGKQIWTYAYWLQAAWYSDGFEAATGKRVHGFVFAAVENKWPHAAAAYMLGDDVLDKARAENRRLLDLYAECKRSGVWPGYPAGIQPIQLPRWANFQEQE
jgi:PDDEXK-like domain of unknown function (DUF3799)